MKKSALFILLPLCACLLFTGCGGSSKNYYIISNNYIESQKGDPLPVYSKSFEIIGGKDVMPVGTYSGPSTGAIVNAFVIESMVNDESFMLYKDLGINMFNASLNAAEAGDNVVKMLELCEKYKMGFFVKDSNFLNDSNVTQITEEEISEHMRKYLKYASYCGIVARDEPDMTQIDDYAVFNENYRKLSFSDMYDLYYNALPIYAGSAMFGTETYEEYVRYYIEKLKLDYFSYDFYPFGAKHRLRTDYFENLSVVKNLCDEYHLPFWSFIQCGASFEGHVSECVPNEGEFIWNVNTCLAYGTKGMQYFTLTQPSFFLDTSDELGATREGIFGYYNNKNEWYYYARKINKQIAAVDEVLMNASNQGVIFHGGSPSPVSTGKEVINAFRQLKSVAGNDSLIGCFDYYGGTAFYVVNNSFENRDAKVQLYFDGEYGFDVIQRATKATVVGNSLELRLDAGEGALVVIK